MAKNSLAPQQARSRESLRKLLKAAAEVLGQHGVEGTTIPRIAEHAGLTPGAVYRRFPDKNALLETAVLSIIEDSQTHMKRMLTPAMTSEKALPELLEPLLAGMIKSYRSHAGVMRGLRQFVQV